MRKCQHDEKEKNVKTLESSPDFRHTAVKNDWTLD